MQKINFFKDKNVLELGGGSANHTKLILENGYDFEIIKEQNFKWRDYYFLDQSFIKMCDNKSGSYFMKDGNRGETLYVVQGKLKPYKTDMLH